MPLQKGLKNLLFEQWIKKWSHTVNVRACTKLYIRLLIIVCNIFMIIFKNYFWNLLSCPRYSKVDFFDQKSAPAISGILAKSAFRRRGMYLFQIRTVFFFHNYHWISCWLKQNRIQDILQFFTAGFGYPAGYPTNCLTGYPPYPVG